jgi:hypothetical protein
VKLLSQSLGHDCRLVSMLGTESSLKSSPSQWTILFTCQLCPSNRRIPSGTG